MGGDSRSHTTDLGSEGDVVLLDLKTLELTTLTSGSDNVKEVSWSPDGTRLSVRRNSGGWFRTAQVHVMDIATRQDIPLTTGGWMRTTLWCGDYVYLRRPPAVDRTDELSLWRVPAGGGPETMILETPAYPRDCRADGAVLYSVSTGAGSELRWLSVDARGRVVADELAASGATTGRAAKDGRIAYVSDEGDATDLFVFDPATGERNRLTDTPWVESAPAWSADGEWIYFTAQPADVDLWWVEVR